MISSNETERFKLYADVLQNALAQKGYVAPDNVHAMRDTFYGGPPWDKTFGG